MKYVLLDALLVGAETAIGINSEKFDQGMIPSDEEGEVALGRAAPGGWENQLGGHGLRGNAREDDRGILQANERMMKNSSQQRPVGEGSLRAC